MHKVISRQHNTSDDRLRARADKAIPLERVAPVDVLGRPRASERHRDQEDVGAVTRVAGAFERRRRRTGLNDDAKVSVWDRRLKDRAVLARGVVDAAGDRSDVPIDRPQRRAAQAKPSRCQVGLVALAIQNEVQYEGTATIPRALDGKASDELSDGPEEGAPDPFDELSRLADDTMVGPRLGLTGATAVFHGKTAPGPISSSTASASTYAHACSFPSADFDGPQRRQQTCCLVSSRADACHAHPSC